jgi:ornithine cyclodeaminase
VAARYACDRVTQTRVLGELHHAIEAGAVDAAAPHAELGQIIAGQAQGRTSDSDITLCDLTGTGAQDTAIATLAVARARAANAGTLFRNDMKR